jgi:hypothetical protein
MVGTTISNAPLTGQGFTPEPEFVANIAYRVEKIAAGIRSAASVLGIELTVSDADRLVAHGVHQCGQLGLTQLGEGVLTRTVPQGGHEHFRVPGCVTATGEWLLADTGDGPYQRGF